MAIIQKTGVYQLERWLRAVSTGDQGALAELYHATATAVYAYALSILKNRHDAEDVLQECYITIFRSAGQYDQRGKPMAWIMTITRNLCLKLLRQQKRYFSVETQDYFGSLTPDPDDRLMLEKCMKVLTDEERQIVVLHAVAGCKHAEIARQLGLKTGTVLSKYHRAIQKLKESF